MNVILITIDCLRKDRLGCYGYEKRISPNIDRLDDSGCRFTQAVTAANSTDACLASILTSTYPLVHGVIQNGVVLKRDSVFTLAEILKRNNFKTAAVVSVEHLSSFFGLNKGFTSYYNNSRFDRIYYLLTKLKIGDKKLSYIVDVVRERLHIINTHWRSAEKINKDARKWLKRNYRHDFFLWIHYFDAHEYKSPEEYDKQIQYVDEKIGEIVNYLKELNIKDKTLFIITSDHGESLGEHDKWKHGYSLYDEVIIAPLIFSYPSILPKLVINNQVRTIDIAPTILDILGIKSTEKWQGVSLLPIIFEGKNIDFDALSYGYPSMVNAKALRMKKWKYICYKNGTEELFDLYNDPSEAKNIIHTERNKVTEIKARFFDLENNFAKNEDLEINQSMKRMLKALGYME